MNCKNCNQDLSPYKSDGFKFCPFCGIRLNSKTKEDTKSVPPQLDNNLENILFPTDNLLVINAFNVDFELIKCPVGKFLMGSPENEKGKRGNETQHEVIIDKEFYIGKYPITQAQYEAVTKCNPSYYKGPNFPVECVNWHQAKEFCYRLNEATRKTRPEGYVFDLPSEAQWEYACRANTTTSLNSGKNITYCITSCSNLDELGWYNSNSLGRLNPVGQKKPNNWGIYDMHGNVCEWCRDYYLEKYLSKYADPDGLDKTAHRVYRGGNCKSNPANCRSAFRFHVDPFSEYQNGFRIALVKGKKITMFYKLGEAPHEPTSWMRRHDK